MFSLKKIRRLVVINSLLLISLRGIMRGSSTLNNNELSGRAGGCLNRSV